MTGKYGQASAVRAYVTQRCNEGPFNKAIIRCLERYRAREVCLYLREAR
jgi:hypothetical protein